MRKYAFTYGLILVNILAFAQGIINNGARIVTSGAARIYIDGNGNADYTSQAGGRIDPSAALIWTMEGDWRNNSANTGFGNDAGTVVLNDAAQSIGGSNSTTFYNLTLQGTGNKTQLINTNVGGVITRTGVLSVGTRIYDLNSFTLTVTNPAIAAVTYGTGYILSETNLAVNPSHMNWYMGATTGAFVYPFGVAGTQIPFTFNKTTAGSSTVAVSTRATAASNNLPWAGASNVAAVSTMFSPIVAGPGETPVVIDRWWDIFAAAPVTANCTFSYRGSENTLSAPYNTGNLGAQHWDGSLWDPPVGSAPAVLVGVGNVTANGLSTFSPWILSSLLAPLPIELVDFTGKCNEKSVSLSWITATEKNNDHFIVERSFNGKDYEVAGTIKGAGNSSTALNYNFTDNVGGQSVLYYRLSQVDFNKSPKVCKIIAVQGCGINGKDITINNTQDGKIFIGFTTEEASEYTVSLYNVLGQKVSSETVNVNEGYSRQAIETSGLPQTYYLLVIQSTLGDIQKTQKVYINNN